MRRRVAASVVLASAVAVACGLQLSGSATSDAPDGGAPVTAPDATTSDAQGGVVPVADAAAEGAIVTDGGAAADVIDEPDALASCTGLICGSTCTDASTCAGCDAGALLCAATRSCASGCEACGDHVIECFKCDGNRQHPVGSCEPDEAGVFCLNANYGNPSSALHCACGSASDCPSSTEVCLNLIGLFTGNACFTCGEKDSNYDTTGATCKSGRTCVFEAGAPRCL